MHKQLSAILGVQFTDEQLLQIALTHRSFWKEQPQIQAGAVSNERLEFLGDAVLNFLTASWLYEHFPAYSEGELSSLRSALVKMTTLAEFARKLDLGKYVRISHSEEMRSGRDREALLADVFEAILGAIYLDQGITAAHAFVQPFLEQEIAQVMAGKAVVDYRTQLQQLLQGKYGIAPEYRIVLVTGPDHRRTFTAEVWKGEEYLGTGSGSNKQAAAQEAARHALDYLQAKLL
jgi:ribonuclease-3